MSIYTEMKMAFSLNEKYSVNKCVTVSNAYHSTSYTKRETNVRILFKKTLLEAYKTKL